MRPQAADLVPLICLACRKVTPEGNHLFTVGVETTFAATPDGDVLSGVLRCVNAGCGARYPIIDGVPIMVPDLSAFLARDIVGIHEARLEPEVAALLALAGPDETPHARSLEIASCYMDAHWGDHSVPALVSMGGPAARHGMSALLARVRALPRVERLIELGTSVGRGLAEAGRAAGLAVGLDYGFGSLARARRLLAGETVRWGRRMSGRHYVPVSTAAGELARPDAVLVCADALDPPFAPLMFDRVLALNLIDAVPDPGTLFAVIDNLCVPGGEIVLSSPYAWQSAHVHEIHRPRGADPAAETTRHWKQLGYQILDDTEVPWSLRRDARSTVVYAAHYLRARKPAS